MIDDLDAEKMQLDATLRSGKVLDEWLSSWLVEAARSPDSAKAVIAESGEGYEIAELRYVVGQRHGGIVYRDGMGAVHIHPAIEHGSGEIKMRRQDEMRAALEIAMSKDTECRKAMPVYRNRWLLYLSPLLLGCFDFLASHEQKGLTLISGCLLSFWLWGIFRNLSNREA